MGVYESRQPGSRSQLHTVNAQPASHVTTTTGLHVLRSTSSHMTQIHGRTSGGRVTWAAVAAHCHSSVTISEWCRKQNKTSMILWCGQPRNQARSICTALSREPLPWPCSEACKQSAMHGLEESLLCCTAKCYTLQWLAGLHSLGQDCKRVHSRQRAYYLEVGCRTAQA